MEQAPFFRTDLDGRKIPVSFEEINPIIRDIVLYFEVNLNEPLNVLLVPECHKVAYWKYLSISWDAPEFSESKRYAWLCQRGCLALLNGLSIDFLDDQMVVGSVVWDKAKSLAHDSLPYLKQYEPSDEVLEAGREFLINTFKFIAEMSAQDLDEDGMPNIYLNSQGSWFTKNVVGDYFRSTAYLDFG